jgi:hypothetical protein
MDTLIGFTTVAGVAAILGLPAAVGLARQRRIAAELRAAPRGPFTGLARPVSSRVFRVEASPAGGSAPDHDVPPTGACPVSVAHVRG